jgi:hypothetical protein
LTDPNPSPSSPGISGSIGPETSGGGGSQDTILKINPAEYEISAEIVQRANQILADFEEV